MTYLGARVLKAKSATRSARLIQEHFIENAVGTQDPLVAESLGGRRMNVTLTGDNLHYNNNSIYWSKKRSEKFMEFQSKVDSSPCSKSPSLGSSRRSSIESFDENEVNCKVHKEVEKLRKKIPDGNRIGFLGINTESDYR